MANSLLFGTRRQAQIIAALTMREIRLRNSRFAFSYFFDIAEAGFIIVLVSALFLFRGKHVDIGDSIILFVASGILPIQFFRSVSMRTMTGLKSGRGVKALPTVSMIDMGLAKSLLELGTYAIVTAALLLFLDLFEITRYAIPSAAEQLVLALVLLFALGFGAGLINAAISVYLPIWRKIWAVTSRLYIFLSGVFMLPETSPPMIRAILDWNPLAHLVAIFRSGLYPYYPRSFMQVDYPLICAALAIGFGIALQRVLRNRLALS